MKGGSWREKGNQRRRVHPQKEDGQASRPRTLCTECTSVAVHGQAGRAEKRIQGGVRLARESVCWVTCVREWLRRPRPKKRVVRGRGCVSSMRAWLLRGRDGGRYLWSLVSSGLKVGGSWAARVPRAQSLAHSKKAAQPSLPLPLFLPYKSPIQIDSPRNFATHNTAKHLLVSTWPPQSIAARDLVTAPRNQPFAIASAARAQPDFWASESPCFSSRNEASCLLAPLRRIWPVASLASLPSYTGKPHRASARVHLLSTSLTNTPLRSAKFHLNKPHFPACQEKPPKVSSHCLCSSLELQPSHFTSRDAAIGALLPSTPAQLTVAPSHLHEIRRRRRWLHFPRQPFPTQVATRA